MTVKAKQQKLTNEQYVECGGQNCPFCGSTDLTGDSIHVEAGKAFQEMGCNECDRSWQDEYKLTGYSDENCDNSDIDGDDDEPLIDTIEYSVCTDCHTFIVHGEEPEDSEMNIEAAVKREIGDKPNAHFVPGIAPTEEDENGEGYEEFSKHSCELCNSTLAGSRYGVTLVIPHTE